MAISGLMRCLFTVLTKGDADAVNCFCSFSPEIAGISRSDLVDPTAAPHQLDQRLWILEHFCVPQKA